MDTLLLIVTVLSLAAAFVSIIAVKKLKHLDQQRADARDRDSLACDGDYRGKTPKARGKN